MDAPRRATDCCTRLSMENFANDAPELRDEAFQETAAQLGMSKAIIEKDFWVCWSLKQLFALPSFGEQMIFKGGTSLSKAYDVIHRFSEDVDLSLDREQLGFVGDRDPEDPDLSSKKQKKLLQELEEAAKESAQDKSPVATPSKKPSAKTDEVKDSEALPSEADAFAENLRFQCMFAFFFVFF